MSCQKEFIYDSTHFQITTEKGQKSDFDIILQNEWDQKYDAELFNYNYEEKNRKIVPGTFRFVAELNRNRGHLKRRPIVETSIDMPFDEDNFHFGDTPDEEVLFHIKPNHWDRNECAEDHHEHNNLLIINASPLAYGSSLLIPSIEKCMPQVLDLDSLRLAVETVLISYDPSMRVGFNSLGAFASVNHHHFHVYYIEKSLYLENAPVKQLSGKCYEVVEYPAKGFVFQVIKKDKVFPVVKSAMRVIKLLQDTKTAHNVFITRGTSFFENVSEGEDIKYNAVRIYIWARKSFFGRKSNAAFNLAVCELSGHLLIKDKQDFDHIKEATVAAKLYEISHDTFIEARDSVVQHMYM